MTSPPLSGFERHCDVAVVGGSAAGLAAALQLSRQRRAVVVVDDGSPRNAPAGHMHGYLGFDGRSPADLWAAGRGEVRAYGGQVLDGRVVDVERGSGDFRVLVTGGHTVVARRLVIATGMADVLPAVEGLSEWWGDRVIHCPFCHGFEFRDGRIVQLIDSPVGWHPAMLYRQLTDRLTVVVASGVEVDDAERDRWERAGVVILDGWPKVVEPSADAEGLDVVLNDGRRLVADAVAVTPRMAARIGPFASLGVPTEVHPSGIGTVVTVEGSGATAVPGVFAAGNVTDPSLQVAQAAANGAWVGAMVSADLAAEDLTAGARRSAIEAEWDGRYGGDRVWSGNPNGVLVAEAAGLVTGRVLDVGAGEGGDAIWLAEQGWKVTATDISTNALDRIQAAAVERGVEIEVLRADVNDVDPFQAEGFDLVTAHYASILRTPDGRAIANLAAAVAPGGTLLVVNHDPMPMRAPIDVAARTRWFDVDAYISIDEVVEHLHRSGGWEILVHETRARLAGSASASHHVDDVVLLARRDPDGAVSESDAPGVLA